MLHSFLGVNLYENLKVHELRCELSKRGMDTTGKKKPQLESEFEELCKGITNVPALLHNAPTTSLQSLYLQDYEISPTETLHDIKGHLSNELLSHTTSDVKKKLSHIYSTVLGKETLRCCDYRKSAILILLALKESHADKCYIEVMRTIVEITEILCSDDSKHSSHTVLRLHNLTFVHGKLCIEVFHNPKSMTRRKMFGRYFHSITSHAPMLYQMVCLRSLNAEIQEQLFGQCKSITKATSSLHPNHIITNILLRLQEEAKATHNLKVQEREITKLANTLGTKQNALIPKQWLYKDSFQYQAHLERIADFLFSGPGSWWSDGIEFFDTYIPGSTVAQHQMLECSITVQQISPR